MTSSIVTSPTVTSSPVATMTSSLTPTPTPSCKPDHNCQGYYECVDGKAVCRCKKGYRLHSDNMTCYDINECWYSNGGCHQICKNTKGSFRCLCRSGFYLHKNGCKCIPWWYPYGK